MHFLTPSLLIWAALAAVPPIVFLFRRRPQKQTVSTLMFFLALAKAHQESPWLRRLKRLMALLLAVLMLLFAGLALGRPVVAPEGDAAGGVVVVIDRSASMAAVDDDGVDRLTAAIAAVRARLTGLNPATPVTVMAYDHHPVILVPRTDDRAVIDRALEALTIRPMADEVEPALVLARDLARLDDDGEIWHVSDHAALPTDESTDPSTLTNGNDTATVVAAVDTGIDGLPPVRVVPISVALADAGNVGITALTLRRKPQERIAVEAFVEISFANLPVGTEATLWVKMDGVERETRTVSVPAGDDQSVRLVFDLLDIGAGGLLELELECEGDRLPLDNRAFAAVPAPTTATVAWFTDSDAPDVFTWMALNSLGSGSGVEPRAYAAGDWPLAEPADLYLFQGWLPDTLPESGTIIAIDPTADVSDISVAVLDEPAIIEGPRALDRRHPLLYGIAIDRLALTQTAAIDASGRLDPLLTGDHGPLLMAGETDGRRIAVVGIRPQASGMLPLMASYPIFLGNAIYWGLGAEVGRDIKVHRSGEVVESAGESVTWLTTPNAEPQTNDLRSGLLELDRLGLWQAGEQTGTANLCAINETRLASRSTTDETGEATSSSSSEVSGRSGELTMWLIAAVLAVLLAESWLFHRHAVY